MPRAIRLNEIIERAEALEHDERLFFNRDSGELEVLPAFRHQPGKRFIALPEKSANLEHNIQQTFAMILADDDIRSELQLALREEDGGELFGQIVNQYDLADAWYEFREQQLLDWAREWCLAHSIEFHDE